MSKVVWCIALSWVVLAGCGEGANRNQVDSAESRPASEAKSETAPELETAYAAYLAERGEDLAGCFGESVKMETGVEADFEDAGGSGAPLRRLVIAIDASGSMAGDAGGQTKMEAAKKAASDFLGGAPEGVDVGLVAFGHRGTNEPSGKAVSCAGVETIYEIGAADEARIRERLGRFRATGWTPLAAALEQAGTLLRKGATEGEQVVYVVSDGKETCEGNPVTTARTLHEGDVRAIVNVIGFDLEAADRAELRQVAEAGGGEFIEAASARELEDIGKKIRNSGAFARAQVSAGGQTARNTVRTAGELTRLSTCVSGRSTREATGVTSFFGAGDPNPEVVAGVQERLRERHARFDALVERVRTDAEADRDVANRALQEQLREIEREYGRLPEAQK